MKENKMPMISLTAARVNAGFTQENAAEKLGVNKKTLANWEKGKSAPDINQFRELCALYNMPGDYIFLPSKST